MARIATQVEMASIIRHPPFCTRRSRRGAKGAGVRYERKVHRQLELKYEFSYFPSVWLRYVDEGRIFYCQPDGLLFLHSLRRLVVVEAKIKHCPEAYDQITKLYMPVLSKIFPRWKLAACEVVRWYDAAVDFPAPHSLKKEVHFAEPGEFAVHILNRV
jgi:hypothetical protein